MKGSVAVAFKKADQTQRFHSRINDLLQYILNNHGGSRLPSFGDWPKVWRSQHCGMDAALTQLKRERDICFTQQLYREKTFMSRCMCIAGVREAGNIFGRVQCARLLVNSSVSLWRFQALLVLI